MSYIPISQEDRQEMLALLGLNSVEELFSSIPEENRLRNLLNLPSAKSEPELLSYFEDRSKKKHF